MANEWYTFGPVAVYDSRPGAADTIVQNGTGGKLVLIKDGAALPIRDLNGTPITEITTNSDGQSILFQAQTLYGLVQFGDIVNPAWAVEVGAKLANQDQVLDAANAAVAAAQQAVAAAGNTSGGTGGTGAVASVSGKVGAVTLVKGDVGLANVDNTSDVNKPISSAEQTALNLKAPLLNPTFSGAVIVPTPTLPSHAVTKAYADSLSGGTTTAAGVTTDAASTSTTSALSAAATRTVLSKQGPVKQISGYGSAGLNGYTSLQQILDSDSSTIVANKLASNNAIITAALVDRPTLMAKGPEDYIPTSLDLQSMSVNLEANLIQYRGDSAAGRTVKPALSIRNVFGAALQGTTGTMQMGANLPSAGVYTQTMSTFVLTPTGGTGTNNQGGYSNYKSGQVGMIYNRDGFPWSVEALQSLVDPGNVDVFRAEQQSIHGIVLNVNAVNLTGSGTAVGGYTPLSLERHQIKGATSNVQAYANSWSADAGGATGKLIFGSVPGDFIVGENLVDVASGFVIGTAGTMALAFFGKLEFDYAAWNRTGGTTAQKPYLRLIDQSLAVNLNVRVKSSHDPDAFLTTTERNVQAVMVAGAYQPQIRVEGISGFSRTLLVKSCYMPVIDVPRCSFVANHAIGTSSANSEEAYGYGVELRGANYYPDIRAIGTNVRHLVTTNPTTGTWEVDNAKHLDYGCGTVGGTVHDSLATNTFGAGFDTHEGCVNLKFVNCRVVTPNSGGRVVTVGSGFNNRGFGTTYENCHVSGGYGGFSSGGEALTAGFRHTISYTNCSAVGWFSNGFGFSDFKSGLAQDGSALGMYATVKFENCNSVADPSITTSQIAQKCYDVGVGKFEWYGSNRAAGFNASGIQMSTGGIHRFFGGPVIDTTLGSNTPFPIRLNGTQTQLKFDEPIKLVRRTSTLPTMVVRNFAGDTMVVHKGYEFTTVTDTNTVRAAAIPFSGTADAGSPTFVDLSASTGGGSSLPTHSIAVAPTVTAGAAAQIGTGGTVTLTTGSTDLAGEIVITTGTGTLAASTSAAPLFSLTYGTAFATDVFPSLTYELTTNTTTLSTKTPGLNGHSAAGFTVSAVSAANASTTYKITYSVSGF